MATPDAPTAAEVVFSGLPLPVGQERRVLYQSSYRLIATYAMPLADLDSEYASPDAPATHTRFETDVLRVRVQAEAARVVVARDRPRRHAQRLFWAAGHRDERQQLIGARSHGHGERLGVLSDQVLDRLLRATRECSIVASVFS